VNGDFATGGWDGWTLAGDTRFVYIGYGNPDPDYCQQTSYYAVSGVIGTTGRFYQTLTVVPGHTYQLTHIFFNTETARESSKTTLGDSTVTFTNRMLFFTFLFIKLSYHHHK
jgi:hypothetical protein